MDRQIVARGAEPDHNPESGRFAFRQVARAVDQSGSFQSVLQFRTGEYVQSASEWRHTFSSAGVLGEEEARTICVFSGRTALSLIARSARGNPVIAERMTGLAKAVTARAGRPVVQELMNKRLFVREDDNIWDYILPRWCVAKSDPDWMEMKLQTLGSATRARLKAQAERSIADQATAWGIVLPSAPRIGIVDAGKPMPIAAFSGVRNGNGKPGHVLARVQVRVVCNLRLNGDWFVGRLSSLGFGRMFRDGVSEHGRGSGYLPAECVLEFWENSRA